MFVNYKDQEEQNMEQKIVNKALKYKKNKKIKTTTQIITKTINTILQILKQFMFYFPKLFFWKRPKFNQIFANKCIYTILSEEGLNQTLSISKQFRLPLLLILVSQNDTNQLIKEMLIDYDISQFLNQAFITCGLFNNSQQLKALKKQVNQIDFEIEEPAFYFIRTTVFDEIQCYGKIYFNIKLSQIADKMVEYRKQHYKLEHLEQQIWEELEDSKLI